MKTTLVASIKNRMDQKSLTVASLEREAGLKIHAVRNILAGRSKKPSAATLQAISKVLECTVDDLLGEKESELKTSKSEIDKFENHDLFTDVIMCVTTLFKQKNLPVTLKEFINIVREIYIYSSRKNHDKLDTKFSEWYFEKYFD